MENPFARRISSMFSISSSSSEQSSNTATSHGRRNPTKTSRTPSPPKQDSVISERGPGPTQLHEPNEDSVAQASQPELGRMPTSPAGMVSSPDELSQPSPPILKPPSPPCSPSSPVCETKLESRLVSRSQSGPASNSKSRSASRTRGARQSSRAESKEGIRPTSPSKLLSAPSQSERRKSTRKSWLPGKSRTHSPTGDAVPSPPKAWLVGSEAKVPYDVSRLVNFQEVPELWDGRGDTLIYLHSGIPGKGPSFKITSASFAASRTLSSVVHGRSRSNASHRPSYQRAQSSSDWYTSSNNHDSRVSSPPNGSSDNSRTQTLLSPATSPPSSPTRESSTDDIPQGRRAASDSYDALTSYIPLHVPLPLQADIANPESILTPDDIETLIAIRNVFAFLTGQPLVGTVQSPTLFTVFLRIADFLQRYQFSNFDGSTLGEECETNFKRYVDDFKLADVRNSREKTIEAIVLGERMKSLSLYNEGFVHGVGKYKDIVELRSSKFHMISEATRQRMERATLDLSIRLNTVRTRLEDFEFPSLFAGVAQSTTSTESKIVHFKEWQAAFMSIRKHVMSFYTHRYGAWPPSARSKKNSFEESGLNRILLRELYQDFCDLYDTLVDRNSLTTRTGEVDLTEIPEEIEPHASAAALRRVLGEFDQSSPPVQPPVPFDTPQLPSLATVRRAYNLYDVKRQKKERSKKLPDDEINQALMQSYNRDCIKPTVFLEAFMNYERKVAHGKSIDEIVDLRNGQWIFMYAVLQSLPLVVIDAPGLVWTEGVEYFLCEVPKGAPPWCPEDHNRKMGWYGIAGGTGVVSLPAELVEHGVEGIYARSYLWKVAQQWTPYDPLDEMVEEDAQFDELTMPPSIPSSPDGMDSRSISPRRSQRDSVRLGLEALPLPPGVVPSGAKRASVYDPSKSFEDILGLANLPSEPKKK